VGHWERTVDGLAEVSFSVSGPGGRPAKVHVQVRPVGPGPLVVRVRVPGAAEGAPVGTFQRLLGWHLEPDRTPQPLRAGAPVVVDPGGYYVNLTLDAVRAPVGRGPGTTGRIALDVELESGDTRASVAVEAR
jgi:hypothetical protein